MAELARTNAWLRVATLSNFSTQPLSRVIASRDRDGTNEERAYQEPSAQDCNLFLTRRRPGVLSRLLAN